MIGTPNFLVVLLLWSWPALAVALFAWLPPRRALAVGLIFGWLFLPQYGFPVPFVKWDKSTATSVGAILGVLIFDPAKLSSFRPSLVDLPMTVWCISPFAAATANGLAPYDAMAAAASQTVVYGVPYFLGRIYYGDLHNLRGLAVWLFVAGLVYAPFCIFETLMSPQSHMLLYGFHQHDFSQVIRGDGFRPMVFMYHGIAVANMMISAALAGIWLWRTKSLNKVLSMPMATAVAVVLVTTLALRSAGALALLMLGVAALFMIRMTKLWLIVLVLCGLPVLYMAARSVGGWDGANAVQMVESIAEKDRSLSLLCRFDNENLLIEKAMKQPLFGWGPNGRNLVIREDGTIESIPDGLWVNALGANGIVGLSALYAALLLPVILLRSRLSPADWDNPLAAGAAVFAIVVVLYAIDNLMNNMFNPIFILGLGGLGGIVAGPATRSASARSGEMPQMVQGRFA